MIYQGDLLQLGFSMFPFYHPTSIVIIDDDQLFLESYGFHFGNDFICRSFHCPNEAIRFIESQELFRINPEKFFTTAHGIVDSTHIKRGDHIIKLKASQLSDILSNDARFRQLSVAIIDYAMPGINGIELCRHLKGFPIKKILLTGKVGEDVAVRAFNEGTIDCFLMKQEPDLPRILMREILQLQEEFFAQITDPLKIALISKDMSFIHDSIFNNFFSELCTARNIVEYYIDTYPPGVILLQADGTVLRLLVYNDDLITTHREIACYEDAPSELIELIESRSILPYFPSESGYYTSDFVDTWRSHIWPIQKLKGSETRYTSLVDEPLSKPKLKNKFTSYADFCRSLERGLLS